MSKKHGEEVVDERVVRTAGRFRTPYRPYERTARMKCKCEDLSRTKQSEAAACDINNIMKKYEQTGVLPEMIKKSSVYGDFADAPTYQESLELVKFSQEQFSALSAKVRARFHNDPAEFLAFASNASNADEMARLGLLKPEAVERVRAEREKAAAALKPSAEPKAKAKKGEDDSP